MNMPEKYNIDQIVHSAVIMLLMALMLPSSRAAAGDVCNQRLFDEFASCRTDGSAAELPQRLHWVLNNTHVFATRTGKIWSLYLSADGSATYHYSTGDVGNPLWQGYLEGSLCFNFRNDQPHACRKLIRAGQGYHWSDTYTGESFSELIFSVDGYSRIAGTPKLLDTRSWIGKEVFGRTIKDKQIFKFSLYKNGQVEFEYASGKRNYGNYEVFSSGEICLYFPSGKICKNVEGASYEGKNIAAWTNSNSGDFWSEIIYIREIE